MDSALGHAQYLQRDKNLMESFWQYKERLTLHVGKLLSGSDVTWVQVDDIVMETFYKACKYAGKFRGSASPLPWLMVIARNELYQELRKMRPFYIEDTISLNANQPQIEEGFPKTMVTEIAVENDYDQKIYLREILEYLRSKIPERKIEMLLLFEKGYSYEEIGNMFGCHKVTSRVAIHRIRKMVREKF